MIKQRVLSIGSSSPVELTINEEINLAATVVIQNHSTSDSLYIGNQNVTTTDYGILIYPESVFSIELSNIDRLYGVSSGTTTKVTVLILDKQ